MKCCFAINIFLDLILLLISFLCTGCGVWLILQEDWSLIIFGLNSVKTLGWVTVGSGILIFLTSILGLCGVSCRRKSCVVMFVTIIGIGCILLIVSATLLFIYQKKVHDFLGNQVKKEFVEKYGFDGTFTHTWDEIQSNLTCCGVDNGGDYKSTKWFNQPSVDFPKEGNVPSSCCKRNRDGVIVDFKKCMSERPEDKSAYIYDNGCLVKIKDKIVSVAFHVAIALFVFSGILVLIMMSGCLMVGQLSQDVLYGQVV